MAELRFPGVLAAVTTPFRADGSVDRDRFGQHCAWLISEGVRGVIPNGSLGEYEALTGAERAAAVEIAVEAVGASGSVVPGVSGKSAAEAVRWTEQGRGAAAVSRPAACAALGRGPDLRPGDQARPGRGRSLRRPGTPAPPATGRADRGHGAQGRHRSPRDCPPMRSRLMFNAVDSHTEGMPTRVITSGVGTLPGATMADRRLYLMNERDDLRTLLMTEPRGHSAMSGAILQPPTRPDADVGVVFIEVSGCLPMCGHGTIGTATVLVETGLVPVKEPITDIRIETPAGLVHAAVRVSDGHARSVTFQNVPAYLHLRDAQVQVDGLGAVTLDVAWGGNYYAILPAGSVGLDVRPDQHDELIRVGLRIIDAVNEQLEFAHPEQPEIAECKHVILTSVDRDARSAVVIHPGWIDRSPCGTGTSARMATLATRGELGLDTDFEHRSLIGSMFTGRLLEETTVGAYRAFVPTITGRAWITGLASYLLDPDDPFPAGFQMGQ